MPKKHQPNFSNYTKYGATSSSSPSSNAAAAKSPSTRSVNERLEQLRREQAPRPSKEKWNDLSTIATAKTVPPHLRHILALPETAPVRPRRGLGGGVRTYGQPRRIPGPPPPSSWVDASMHAPAGLRARARREMKSRMRERAEGKVNAAKLRCRPTKFSMLSRLPDTPHPLPIAGSLKHHALKALAENWDWMAEFEENNLAALPVYLKSCFLSYLSLFGPDGDISIASLKTLFLSDMELPGGTGSSGIKQLDLSGLLNHQLTLQHVFKYMAHGGPETQMLGSRFSRLRLDDNDGTDCPATNPHTSTTKPTRNCDGLNQPSDSDDDLTSWEDLLNSSSDTDSPPLSINPTGSRFPSLTRLSLASAGSYASWSTLLTLSPHLTKLTHLSLAHWPSPTTTPNSRTTFIQAYHTEINLGGTHLYSVIDEDWDEAANILRRLSLQTFRLRWLDLEGCGEWVAALVWDGVSDGGTVERWGERVFQRPRTRTGVPQSHVAPVAEVSFGDEAEGTLNGKSTGPDWNGAWDQVTYVNVSQGSLPRNVTALRRLPAGRVGCDLLLYLREREDNHDKDNDVDDDGVMDDEEMMAPVQDCVIPAWLESEKAARRVAAEIQSRRTRAGGRYCVFDHGWKIPALVKGSRESL